MNAIVSQFLLKNKFIQTKKNILTWINFSSSSFWTLIVFGARLKNKHVFFPLYSIACWINTVKFCYDNCIALLLSCFTGMYVCMHNVCVCTRVKVDKNPFWTMEFLRKIAVLKITDNFFSGENKVNYTTFDSMLNSQKTILTLLKLIFWMQLKIVLTWPWFDSTTLPSNKYKSHAKCWAIM